MGKVRAKNTKIEIRLFEELERAGLNFHRHFDNLPGRPDIVFFDCKLAVFVDGDFWHGRGFSNWCRKLDKFWFKKIETNIKRDRRNDRRLRAQGWGVLHVWGKEIERKPARCLDRILMARAKKYSKYRESYRTQGN
jgi:DNA mismatch endonuclease, patch repair protein